MEAGHSRIRKPLNKVCICSLYLSIHVESSSTTNLIGIPVKLDDGVKMKGFSFPKPQTKPVTSRD